MRADRWLCLFCIITGLGFFFSGISCVEAGQFKADMVQSVGGKSKTGKIYVKYSKYRMEEKEEGRQLVILVDMDMGITRVLAPMEKKYKEMKTTDMGSLANDPIQAARFSAMMYTKKNLGTEVINGYACDKSSFYHENQLLMTQWVSKKLMFHLKIVTHGPEDRTLELKNIQEGPVDEKLFKVPSGYAMLEDPMKKREREEAALSVVTTSVRGASPWARRIGKGGEIRVTVDPEKSVRFKVKNLIAEESVFTIKAFKNGRPVTIDIEETHSLTGRGRGQEPLLGMQNKADEVAVRVEKGKITAHIKEEASAFAKDKVKAFFLMTGTHDWQQGFFVDNKRLLRLIITGDSQDAPESVFKVEFYKGDDEDKIDEADVVLKNGQTKTWEYGREKGIKNINIMLAKGGGIRVMVEQSEPFQLTKETKTQVSLALQNNDLDKMKTFLARGLDVNATLQGDGTSVLMKASNSAGAEMVKMLLARGADINYTNKYGWTALLKALDNYKRWAEVAPILIKSGADVNATLKSNGYTPLWKAIGKIKKNKGAAIGIIKSLLSKGADVNAPYISKDPRYSGGTPLMSAAKYGFADVVKLLLSHGADADTRDKAGKTALDHARAKGHQAVVGLLSGTGGKKKAPTAMAKPRPTSSKDKKEISAGEIPPYKGADVQKSLTDGKKTIIEMESTASPEEIVTFYKTEMTGKGWTVKIASVKAKGAMLMMFKGTRIFMLSAGQRGEKTKVSLRLSGD